jgi:hypothetical protein
MARDPNRQLKDALLWLRKNKYACSSISIGGMVVDGLRDLSAVTAETKPQARKTMFEEFGAALLDQPVSKTDEVPDEAKID